MQAGVDREAAQELGAPRSSDAPVALSRELRAHLASSYPHNHDYRLVGRRRVPSLDLWARARRLRALYPKPLESLLDVASCKGWFVLDAVARSGARRALGIDVHAPDLAASRAARAHLGLERARFEQLHLHELARRIGEFGGPFQTVLAVNVYPYLYFGSARDAHGYRDHRALFGLLREVCAERLVFSNRTSLARCPHNVRERARALGDLDSYEEPAIRAAAEEHFHVEPRGKLGRIPLWLLTAR